MAHISVLMDEVIDSLDIQKDDIIVDGTINGGGHSLEISKHLESEGVLIGIDQDKTGLEISSKKLSSAKPSVHLIHNNFRNIDQILQNLNYENFDKLLLDLGWSSNQFENPDRGFSFMHDGPLLMTLSDDPEKALFTAHEIVNTWREESLIDIFEVYGEESFSKQIAKAIVQKREISEINSTLELADLIKESVPAFYRNGKIHPATKVFQAIRIAANDEMGALRDVLEKSFNLLKPGGRISIISFHSVEDRVVKNFFRARKQSKEAVLLTKKPIIASKDELGENRRARSAKLRVLIKS